LPVDRARIEIVPELLRLFAPPRGAVRFRAAHGGRGSGKSFSFALMAAVWGYAEPLRILATRELQISIKESFHAELSRAIASQTWLAAHYEIGESFIRARNGTEVLFRGLRHNIASIKSMSGVNLCIVEEAEAVPEQSWRDLLPTIREPKSEIWAIWNPEVDGSPVDQRFRKSPPADALVSECHYWHNPWFPAVLEAQRRDDQARLDPNTYAHIWEGAYLTNSAAQVLANKVRVAEFTPAEGWDGPYHGLDWGFSQDPTAAVRCWIHGGALHVEQEAGKIGLELDDTAPYMRAKIPGIERYVVRADSARPESISHVSRRGLQIVGVRKWPGSVQDGIEHLRSYREIVIHPRCRETIRETRLYSYKVDRLTGDVLPDVVDAFNHYIDAIRYAIEPLIKQRSVRGDGLKVPGM
jgi:phage terminase large subunit